MKVIRYKVTVTAVIERKEMCGGEWARTTAAPDAPFAHTPPIEKTVLKELAIYEQTLDTLDMRAVIRAVNDISS